MRQCMLCSLILSGLLVIPLEAVGGDRDVFVAVGYGGRRMISRDGVHWEITAEWEVKGGDNGNNLMGLVFAEGKFVAVGGGGGGKTGAGHILVSRDARSWKEVRTFKNRVNPIMHGSGRFVVGGPGRRFYWSADGETWKDGAVIASKAFTHFRHGAFGNGVFLAVGNGRQKTTDGMVREIYWGVVTPDGEKISHELATLPPLRGLAFGNGRFVAVGPDGLRMTSRDGVSWEHKHSEAGNDLTSVVWTGKAFFASGRKPYTSEDGITWKPWPGKVPCQVKCVTTGLYIGTSWPGQMWSSTDGKTWTKGKALTPNGINKVVHGRLK